MTDQTGSAQSVHVSVIEIAGRPVWRVCSGCLCVEGDALREVMARLISEAESVGPSLCPAHQPPSV